MPVWATALEHARTEPINETANTIAADGPVTNTLRGILVACRLGDAAIAPPSRAQKNCGEALAPCAQSTRGFNVINIEKSEGQITLGSHMTVKALLVPFRD